jgi:hypothetical protein
VSEAPPLSDESDEADERFMIRVRLFHDALDGSGFDHLTSVSFGLLAPSGLGTAPLA